jgi:hypothetical protein
MTFPALLFGVILSALLAAAFHFWKAEPIKKLILYLLLSEAGFWVGHFIGAYLHWSFAAIGPLNAGMGILGSALFLFVGRWLSQVEVSQKK